MPRVSVLIDNYNYARFLPAAVDSVLAQDFPKDQVEILVVDDGSTDDSRKVIEGYGAKVRGIFKENGGYASAFNAGAREARGEFICLLDADDAWLPGKLKEVVAAFDKNPDCGLVQHPLQDTDAELRPLSTQLPAWPERVRADDYLAGRFEMTATSALSFRRDCFLKALPIPEGMRFLYADDYLTLHALFQSPALCLSSALALHRVHGANHCAGGLLGDPQKLAADLEMGAIYEEKLNGFLNRSGKDLSPAFRGRRELELMRRELLLAMHQGHRRKAFGLWLSALKRHGLSPFGLFRLATCSIALLSPALYLSLYEGYAASSSAKAARRAALSS